MKEISYICSRIDTNLRTSLKIYCAEKNLSIQKVISLAIKDYIEKYEKNKK